MCKFCKFPKESNLSSVWLTELQISYYTLRNWEKMASNFKDGEDEKEWEDRLIWYPIASSG